jgi:NADH-quinone oxidoreductase subunit N
MSAQALGIQSDFSATMFVAISPLLLMSFGIVLALLLIAWRRSQKLIALFSQTILLFTLLLSIQLWSIEPTQVTMLLLVDNYSYFSFSLITFAALFVVVLSGKTLRSQEEVHDEYYVLILLVVLGAGILVCSDHFASVFLAFELLSISLVGLVGYIRTQQYSVETGFKYLVLSASASSFMLLGIAFIYSQTGNLSFSMESSLAAVEPSIFHRVGVLLFISGIAFKLSLAPFHLWTPDIYQGASTPITLLMATVSKVAMFTILMKYFIAQQYFKNANLAELVLVLAILSMLTGNILALRQKSIKRLLAYSGIAHFGYLLIVLIFSSSQDIAFAWQSVLFYLMAYVLASLSIFTVLILVELSLNQENKSKRSDLTVNDIKGLFWQSPSLAVLFLISVLSFAGIPLTMGFIGKFYILNHAVLAQSWLLIGALVIGSGIGLAYYLPLIFSLFAPAEHRQDKSLQLAKTLTQTHVKVISKESILVLGLIVMSILFGLFPDLVSQYII